MHRTTISSKLVVYAVFFPLLSNITIIINLVYMELKNGSIKSLALGSTLLATGGGFPFAKKHQKLKELKKTSKLHLISPHRLHNEDYVCAVSGIGSADNTKGLIFSTALTKGIKTVEQLINKPIKAILPGEIGIENVIFELATSINLPVLDADTAGRRAVPEMNHDTFVLANESILPVVIVSLDGIIKIIDNPNQENEIEDIARETASTSTAKTVLIFSHIKKISKIKKIASLHSLTTCINLGDALKTNDLPTIQNHLFTELQGEIITTAKVTTVFKDKSSDFLSTIVTLRTPQGILDLTIKNEVLALQKGQEYIVHIPDSICLLDLKTFLPVHSSELVKGHFIAIIKIPAIPQWQTAKGHEIFGLEYLKN
mgnify:CR=1 FL=1